MQNVTDTERNLLKGMDTKVKEICDFFEVTPKQVLYAAIISHRDESVWTEFGENLRKSMNISHCFADTYVRPVDSGSRYFMEIIRKLLASPEEELDLPDNDEFTPLVDYAFV